jgi:XTP/dITP diphosphohydrolase
MNTLIFATNNQHKVDEIRTVIGTKFNIITLSEAGIDIDIPEPHETIEENAAEKSLFIYNLTNKDCFGEDTGLEIDALNGEPGVLSARYGGEEKSHRKNIEKVLNNLKGVTNRNAQFKTIISLMINGKQHQFEGLCKGKIIDELKGNDGFGYDPIFVPEGSHKTFGEMTMEEKNIYSHRRKATDKLIAFLKN